MTLDELPDGSAVVVDANVLIYARRGMSAQCRRLIERVAAKKVTGLLPAVALAEFCHRRMMQEAQSKGLAAVNPAKALAQSPQLVRPLAQYAHEVEDLLAGEIQVLELAAGDFPRALELQRQSGLLTNDSLLVAAGLRAGTALLATCDPQFDAVPGLTVFKPDDVK